MKSTTPIVQPYLYATRAMAGRYKYNRRHSNSLLSYYLLAWLSGLFDHYIVDGLVNFASNLTLDVAAGCAGCRLVRSTLPVRNSGRGDADIAGARGRKSMTDQRKHNSPLKRI